MNKLKIFLKNDVNLIYLFIVASPLLDSISSIFKLLFPNLPISVSAVLRLLIPAFLLVKIFFTSKKERIILLIYGGLVILYGAFHLWYYKNNLTSYSFGSLMHESQYLVYYSFSILILFLILRYKDKIDDIKLKNCLYINLITYSILLFISIITGTASTTYSTGLGLKGWFNSGNFLSSSLLISLSLAIPFFKKFLKSSIYLVVFLSFFMLILLGTRVGYFGYMLIAVIYIISEMIIGLIRKTVDKKTIVLSLVLIFSFIFLFFFEPYTFQRRQDLDIASENLVDENGEATNLSEGMTDIRKKITNGTMTEEMMSKEQQTAFMNMAKISKEKGMTIAERREMAFVYSLELYKLQKNPVAKIFGNGHLINYPEFTLETEIVAMIFNFGILGFILFYLPYILISFYLLYVIIKNVKRVNVTVLLAGLSILFTFAMSLLVNYTFFFSTLAMLFACSVLIILKRCKQ